MRINACETEYWLWWGDGDWKLIRTKRVTHDSADGGWSLFTLARSNSITLGESPSCVCVCVCASSQAVSLAFIFWFFPVLVLEFLGGSLFLAHSMGLCVCVCVCSCMTCCPMRMKSEKETHKSVYFSQVASQPQHFGSLFQETEITQPKPKCG